MFSKLKLSEITNFNWFLFNFTKFSKNLKMGKMIDDYHLEKMIGSGQYGKVYMATNTKTKQVVAIKCISLVKFR